MSIRGRVTLWYSAVLLISFLLAGGGMYYELVYERDTAGTKSEQQEPMEEEVGEVLIYYILPALIATVFGGWWLLRRSLKPLDQLTRAAERINAQNLQEALPRTGNGDEVDRLSEVLNAMNQRLAVAMNEIHEFTLHASHELKTPLTILHAEIETSLGSPTFPADHRESLSRLLDEIQRLTKIVEGLNFLARTNSRQIQFSRDAVPIHSIVREFVENTSTLARPRNINVSAKILEPVTILGDSGRLRQVFLNLADNACKFNVDGGLIKIDSRSSFEGVEVEISNTGPGINPADLPKLFRKFFRGANQPGTPEGVGLGLNISEAIVRAHQGKITIVTADPKWTTICVSLPHSRKNSE